MKHRPHHHRSFHWTALNLGYLVIGIGGVLILVIICILRFYVFRGRTNEYMRANVSEDSDEDAESNTLVDEP